MRFILRMIKRFALLAVVIAVGYTYFNNSEFQANANQDLVAVHQGITKVVDRYLPGLSLDNGSSSSQSQSGQKKTKSAQGDKQPDIPTDGRWPTNQASVYINTGNAELDQAANEAVAAWNQTGAFNFTTTTSKSNADIVVSAMNDNQSGAAGLTQASTNPMTKRIVHADVYLNSYYLTDPEYGYSHQRVVNTAEHELGHAIGLEHTNQTSVMQPAGSFYSIQPVDVQAVQTLYGNA